MNEEKVFIVKRHIELEEWLEKNYRQNNSNDESAQKIFDNFENTEDIDYLIDAYLMPKKEIEKALENYDNHKFPFVMDELKFIDDLSEQYDMDRQSIVKRIIDVREMNIIENMILEDKKVKKRKK